MPKTVTFEAYAPALYGDPEFIPRVTTLVRDHLDENGSESVVISRTSDTDRLIPVVTNRAVVFQDPRYYFGHLCTSDVLHNSRKLSDIRDATVESGLYEKFAGEVLNIALDTISSREVETSTGKKTLLVATASGKHIDSNANNTLQEYTEEIVGSTNSHLARRKSLMGVEFNSLTGTIPIVSLGFVALENVDMGLLIKNIEELVEEPMPSLVAVPNDGLVTKLTN